jgi:hypothetical protein
MKKLIVTDRCLQTSKPTAIALDLPLYVEHGMYYYSFIVRHITVGNTLKKKQRARVERMVFPRSSENRPAPSPGIRIRPSNLPSRNRPHRLVHRMVPFAQGRNRGASARPHRRVSERLRPHCRTQMAEAQVYFARQPCCDRHHTRPSVGWRSQAASPCGVLFVD